MKTARLACVLAAFFVTFIRGGVNATAAAGKPTPTSSTGHTTEAEVDTVSDLAVRLTPNIAQAPSDVRALVRVPRHIENRLLRIVIDSDDYYRSSDISLDGVGAPNNHFVTWKSLPPGMYRISVELYGSTGLRKTVSAGPVRLVGLY